MKKSRIIMVILVVFLNISLFVSSSAQLTQLTEPEVIVTSHTENEKIKGDEILLEWGIQTNVQVAYIKSFKLNDSEGNILITREASTEPLATQSLPKEYIYDFVDNGFIDNETEDTITFTFTIEYYVYYSLIEGILNNQSLSISDSFSIIWLGLNPRSTVVRFLDDYKWYIIPIVSLVVIIPLGLRFYKKKKELDNHCMDSVGLINDALNCNTFNPNVNNYLQGTGQVCNIEKPDLNVIKNLDQFLKQYNQGQSIYDPKCRSRMEKARDDFIDEFKRQKKIENKLKIQNEELSSI